MDEVSGIRSDVQQSMEMRTMMELLAEQKPDAIAAAQRALMIRLEAELDRIEDALVRMEFFLTGPLTSEESQFLEDQLRKRRAHKDGPMSNIARLATKHFQQSKKMRTMMELLAEHNPVQTSEVHFHMPLGSKRMSVEITESISAMIFEETEYGWYGTGKPFTGTLQEVANHCHQVIEGYKILHNV